MSQSTRGLSERALVVERITLLVLLVTCFLVGYFGLSELNSARSYYVDVALPFEAELPFVVWMIYPYNLNLVVVTLAILAVPVEEIAFYRRVAFVFAVNLAVAFVFFIVAPVQMVARPELLPIGEMATDLAAFMFWVDRPTNLFPSLHVQLSVVSALTLASRGRLLGILGFSIAVAVFAATVLLKQHYIADGLLGATIAGCTWYLVVVRRETGQSEADSMVADVETAAAD